MLPCALKDVFFLKVSCSTKEKLSRLRLLVPSSYRFSILIILLNVPQRDSYTVVIDFLMQSLVNASTSTGRTFYNAPENDVLCCRVFSEGI